ncbi:MAG TPA: hypothetical protein VLI71_00310, partial [Gammaproteobacteria bacterium]|nr:hypothetical protein [Gammaproteobacteria bacterium]
MINRTTWTVVGTVLLFLAGCGGGGDDDPSPAPTATITTTNAPTIARSVVKASLEGRDLGSFAAFGPMGGSASSPKSARVYYSKVAEIQNAAVDALLQHTQTVALVPVGPEVSQCTGGGTVTLSGNIANPATLGPNDTITLDFASCVEGDTTTNGQLSMRVTSFSGDPASGTFSFAVTTTITSFQVTVAGETATVNGTVSISTSVAGSTLTTTVTSSSISVGDGGSSHTLHDYSSVHTLTSGSFTLDVSGSLTSSDFSGTASFDTTVLLQGMGEDYAFVGQLLITGANGATIKVIVLDSTFLRLEVDSNGD